MRANRFPTLLVLAATLAAATAFAAPGPPAQVSIDRVRVTGNGLHELVVRVQDENGAAIAGLERALALTLDGRGVGEMHTEFSGGAGARTLLVVVDAPLLRGEAAESVDDVLRSVARELAPEDRVRVLVAGEKAVAREWSAREVVQSGDRLAAVAAAGGPRLLDALRDAASQGVGRRRLGSGAVLVVTRGEDRGSRAHSSDVLAALLRGGVTSLAVVVVPGAEDDAGAQQLERLARLSGGTLWRVERGLPLPLNLAPGVRALLDRYRVTFRDPQWRRDGETHQLEARAGEAATAPAGSRAYLPADVYEPAWWATPALWVVVAAVLVVAAFLLFGRRTRQVCLLVVQGGEEDGQWFEVLALPLRIGSARENDVVIVSEGVSRNHCLLEREGRSIVLQDTNSEFGTFVNGARVTRHVLEEDDVIRLGPDVELAYEGR